MVKTNPSKPFTVQGEEKEAFGPFGEYIGLMRMDTVYVTYHHPHPYADGKKKKDVAVEFKYYLNNVEVTAWGETVH